MSKDWFLDIYELHRNVFGDDILSKPHILDIHKRRFRIALIQEEVMETIHAIQNNDLVEIADGIADSIVVLLGTAVEYGIDIRPVWNEVHRTNMNKKGGPVRGDGKRLKPPDWQPPQISQIIRDQMLQDTPQESPDV